MSKCHHSGCGMYAGNKTRVGSKWVASCVFHKPGKVICPTSCQSEGFVYPDCLCTEKGRKAIREADLAARDRWMDGQSGYQS